MAKKTINPITLEEIMDAFHFPLEMLKMEDIKDRVYSNRNNSYYNYNSRDSFNQTIQDIVQAHTKGGHGFTGVQKFKKIERAVYQLF